MSKKKPKQLASTLNAQERTRTSTPVRAQALNLLRMPIPPPGLGEEYYSLSRIGVKNSFCVGNESHRTRRRACYNLGMNWRVCTCCTCIGPCRVVSWHGDLRLLPLHLYPLILNSLPFDSLFTPIKYETKKSLIGFHQSPYEERLS